MVPFALISWVKLPPNATRRTILAGKPVKPGKRRRRDALLDRGNVVPRVVLLLAVLIINTALSVQASSAPSISRIASPIGLHIYGINGRKFGIRTQIHVLAFNDARFTLAIGLANHAIDGGLQTPSSMCDETPGCVAAINGDFFDLTPAGIPDPGDEVGGIIQNCVLLHSSEISHQQVILDGHIVSNGLNWTSTLSVNDMTFPINSVNQELPLSYPGVSVPLRGTLLYTSAYALDTPTGTDRTTYEFTQVNGASSPTTINSTAELTFVGETTQPQRVAIGQVDISAPTNSALGSIPVGSSATLSTSSTAGCDDIGGIQSSSIKVR